MRFWGKVGLLALLLSFLAFSSTSLARGRQEQQSDRTGWGERWDGSQDNHPPGWDKGKKTGWRGDDEPPGQAKKHRRHHKEKYKSKHRGDGRDDWRGDRNDDRRDDGRRDRRGSRDDDRRDDRDGPRLIIEPAPR